LWNPNYRGGWNAAGTLAQLVIGRIIDLWGYKPAFVWAGVMYLLAAMFGPHNRSLF